MISKFPTVICLPTPQELQVITQGVAALARSDAFDRVAGALDGCHVRIKSPGNVNAADYINYKLFPSIHLQAVCDAQGRFLDIFVGYPGSVHDAKVLHNSPIFTRSLYPPPGYYLLADGAYPCIQTPIGIITPFKTPLRGRIQEHFNAHHARARSVVERAFGVMKARWSATLNKSLEVSPTYAPVVVACCAFLHNICIGTNDGVDEVNEEDTEEPQPGPAAPVRWQERPGDRIRDTIAARASIPARLPAHLNEHDYL